MIRSWLRHTTFAVALLALTGAGVSAQSTEFGRPLDHTDYDRWNRIGNQTLSPDGQWLAYRVIPGDDDASPTLILKNVDSGAQLTIPGGGSPSFTDDSRFMLTLVSPNSALVDSLETAREDDDTIVIPTDELHIVPMSEVFQVPLNMGAIRTVADVDGFDVPGEGPAVVAIQMNAPDEEEMEEDEEAESEEMTPQEERRADKDVGAPLILHDLASGQQTRFEAVTDYGFTWDGEQLYYTASSRDGMQDGVYRVDTNSRSATPLITGEGRYEQLAISGGEEGSGAVAFLTDRDDQMADEPNFSLYAAQPGDSQAQMIAGTRAAGIPDGWGIFPSGNVSFSERGSRVFFGTRELPEPEPEEEESDEEMVEVDIWNWKDDYLQPQQLIQARGADTRTWEAMVPVNGGAVLQIEDRTFDNTQIADGREGNVAITRTSEGYRQEASWDRTYYDYYLWDLSTGQREMIRQKQGGGIGFTPDNSRLTWFDGTEMHWFMMDPASGQITNLSEGLPFPVHNELEDRPQDPGPYGSAGWSEDGRFIVYDRYDIWAVDPSGARAPQNLTEGMGRENRIEFRYESVESGQDFVPMDEDVYLSAFGELTKNAGWFRDNFGGTARPRELVFTAHDYGNPQKAEDADRFLLTRETFREFPDLYTADGNFSGFERHSDANPQQAEYRWGTAELYEWISADGIPLQGILYKPDGFDPNEEYPMMVYFYERSSDGLHGYTTPSAGSSSINRSFYVSRGYLLFVPDIPYEIGFPGESAEDAIIPGVLGLISEGFVDAENIGVQGHSWGGYQISHMITRSDIFAAAEAGAPVVNMTSAYGGIRWASGMSRAFQYEKTQSRIGGTLWDSHQKFIENSPLFFVDKINTPLLMLHNDEDGAVPWYQGIEMFSAMRRLQKPVWMLNYNGEGHGLGQDDNRRDWAIRMQQFFDHFLMDAPAPIWLEEGVPGELKGKTLGLGLVQKKPITQDEMDGAGMN